MADEVQLELALGRPVVDREGRRAGHVEEFRAEQRDGEWVVVEYLLGAAGLLERLGIDQLSGLLGLPLPRRARYRVPWDQLDISDPRYPRLSGRTADLRPDTTPRRD
jgi:hypothetical protein